MVKKYRSYAPKNTPGRAYRAPGTGWKGLPRLNIPRPGRIGKLTPSPKKMGPPSPKKMGPTRG